MNRNRGLALVLVLIAGIGGASLVYWRSHHPSPSTVKGVALTAPDRASASAAAAAIAPHRFAIPTHVTIAADPERSARAWIARSDEVVMVKNERQFGTAVAHLLTLSPGEAWTALTARARDGDVAAATAAMLLALECKARSDPPSLKSMEDTRFVDHLATSVPQDWERFFHAIDAQQRERLRARIIGCGDVGGVGDFALMALDRFLRPDDPDTQLAEAADIRDDATAIADLRQLADQTASENARRVLGERLMQSADVGNQAEGRALLEQLAANDADVVSFLAMCFHERCGFFRGDPDVAEAWVERAAGLGEWWALTTHMADLGTTGQTAEAWGWALYRLDLASAGCFETNQPQFVGIAQAAQDAFRLEHSLDADQQATGRAAALAIAAQWETQAATRLGCAG
jgi:hypothetical protein